MNDKELNVLNEFKRKPIPRSLSRDTDDIFMIYIIDSGFITYLDAVLQKKYKKGFKKKSFDEMSGYADQAKQRTIGQPDEEDVKKYFELFFQCVEIVAKELKELKTS